MKKSRLLLIIGVALVLITSCKKKEPAIPPIPVTPGAGDVQSIPYAQSFAKEFGTYITKNVLGDQVWVIDYSSAVMSGHVNNNGTHEYYENEDWLISSPVKITGVQHAKAVVNYAAQYQGPSDTDVVMMISSDYKFGNEPSTATWTQLPEKFANTDGWNFTDKELNLDNYLAQTVTVAIKFTSSSTKSRTMEIKSITVKEGEAGGVTPPGPTPPPGTGSGSGTADDPYNVASGISLQGQEIIAWVQGYIVGAVKNGLSAVSSNDDVIWNAPFDSSTNVVIADDADCREISNCIIVNLPAGKPLRAQVNLKDNPDNLGKQLSVLGKLRKYFGQAGLRDSEGTEADFVLEGGVTPPPVEAIYSESFASGQGGFTIQDVVIPAELTYVWAYSAQYKCMKASAYVGQAYQTESWLVSPAINLSGVETAKLTFDQAVNYAAPQGVLYVMISTNYSGDVTTTDWTELTLDQWPEGNSWTFINSIANLTPYIGQNVTVAFKYTSSAGSASTWEVKNFIVAE